MRTLGLPLKGEYFDERLLIRLAVRQAVILVGKRIQVLKAVIIFLIINLQTH